MKITIHEIVDGVIWLLFEDDEGNPVWKQPFAQCIRDHVEPEYQIALKRDDGYQPEVAIKNCAYIRLLKRH